MQSSGVAVLSPCRAQPPCPAAAAARPLTICKPSLAHCTMLSFSLVILNFSISRRMFSTCGRAVGKAGGGQWRHAGLELRAHPLLPSAANIPPGRACQGAQQQRRASMRAAHTALTVPRLVRAPRLPAASRMHVCAPEGSPRPAAQQQSHLLVVCVSEAQLHHPLCRKACVRFLHDSIVLLLAQGPRDGFGWHHACFCVPR